MKIPPILALGFGASLAIAACSGGGASPASSPAASAGPSAAPASQAASSEPSAASPAGGGASTLDVKIVNFAFEPEPVVAKVGETITWTNNDAAPHTVTLDDGSADSGNLAKGSTFDHAFDAAGTYTYHCAIHSQMKGTIEIS